MRVPLRCSMGLINPWPLLWIFVLISLLMSVMISSCAPPCLDVRYDQPLLPLDKDKDKVWRKIPKRRIRFWISKESWGGMTSLPKITLTDDEDRADHEVFRSHHLSAYVWQEKTRDKRVVQSVLPKNPLKAENGRLIFYPAFLCFLHRSPPILRHGKRPTQR